MSKRTGNKDTRAAKHRSRRHARRIDHRKRKIAARASMLKSTFATMPVGGMAARFAAIQRAVETSFGLHAPITLGQVPRLASDHPLMLRFMPMVEKAKHLLGQLENKRARRYPGQEWECEALEADVAELQPPMAALAEQMRAWADANPHGVVGEPIQIPGAAPAGTSTAVVLRERVEIENDRMKLTIRKPLDIDQSLTSASWQKKP